MSRRRKIVPPDDPIAKARREGEAYRERVRRELEQLERRQTRASVNHPSAPRVLPRRIILD